MNIERESRGLNKAAGQKHCKLLSDGLTEVMHNRTKPIPCDGAGFEWDPCFLVALNVFDNASHAEARMLLRHHATVRSYGENISYGENHILQSVRLGATGAVQRTH